MCRPPDLSVSSNQLVNGGHLCTKPINIISSFRQIAWTYSSKVFIWVDLGMIGFRNEESSLGTVVSEQGAASRVGGQKTNR